MARSHTNPTDNSAAFVVLLAIATKRSCWGDRVARDHPDGDPAGRCLGPAAVGRFRAGRGLARSAT